MTNPNENEKREQEGEAGHRAAQTPSERADRKSGAGSGNGSPTAAPACGGLRLPPDLRTDEEKAEDDRAAEENLDRTIDEGYDIKEKDDGTDNWRKIAKKRRQEERRARREHLRRWLCVALNWAFGRRRGPR